MTPYAEVIGDPIGHSKSPLLHRFWLDCLGVPGRYDAVRVSIDGLQDFLHGRRSDPRWRGCNVTMPLKQAAMALVDVFDETTRRIGALNLILNDDGRLVGANTDWQAIRALLDRAGVRPERATIIGTGGAARAALEEMRRMGIDQVDLVSRSPDRAFALLAEFGLAGEAITLGGRPEGDMLINASPLGMAGQPKLDLDLSGMAADATVFDMVYTPAETDLLREARSRGLRTIEGLDMLIGQAAFAFGHFFGKVADPVESSLLRDQLTS